ncbi:MAG TPA: fused MFS/spermidine synthase [Anaerolineaceae bacterium]|nr:fused MFS/spermidine synthase [Anaerolineaceae bacterium]
MTELTPKNRKLFKEHLFPRSLGLIVFLGGMGTMMLEFAASRLLGNVFGTSNLVWAVIIGLILVYLTMGNWLGGKWADASPKLETLGFILACAGVSTGLVPMIARPILRISADAFDALNIGLLAGTFVSVIILLIIPVTLLGMVTPFALRLAIRSSESSGKVSGALSAISTLGSFIGTFLTVLVLIPFIGTYRTFIFTAGIILLIGLGIFWSKKKFKHLLIFGLLWLGIVILGVVGIKGFDKISTGLIYEKESAYNYIQVLQYGDFRFLRLNEGQGMHSIYNPNQYYYAGPWSQALIGFFFNPGAKIEDVKRIALVGLAAGTSARQASVALPQAEIDGIEIDPEIVKIGRSFFGMDLPNLQVIVGDGRWEMERLSGPYDIISVDAYRPPYIPAHMVTTEFFKILNNKLTPNGVVAINVGRGGDDRSLVNALASTLNTVFPKVLVVDLPESQNSILFACKNQNADWEYLAINQGSMVYASEDQEHLLFSAIGLALEGKSTADLNEMVFTDDLAPIEFITNRMVLEYLTKEEME